jgi:hypothetical protein
VQTNDRMVRNLSASRSPLSTFCESTSSTQHFPTPTQPAKCDLFVRLGLRLAAPRAGRLLQDLTHAALSRSSATRRLREPMGSGKAGLNNSDGCRSPLAGGDRMVIRLPTIGTLLPKIGADTSPLAGETTR